MYIKYFGLSQSPFRTAPDPEYFFASGQHLRAVDRVVHALRERAGLVLVMGEIGQGKTTVCRYIQKRYADEFCIGYLGNPFLSAREFGEQMLLEFGVSDVHRTSSDIIRSLTDFLLEQERAARVPVLFLDEAHLLSPEVLEFLLIVTNIQHRGKHLLQMVLAGQNEFQETLRHPRFSSLNQRLGTRIQVTGLTVKDVVAYISFRIAQAGGEGKTLFTHPAMVRIFKVTKGNPRLINQVCERLLERAYEQRSSRIRRNDVQRLTKDPIFMPLLFPQGGIRIPWGGVVCAGFILLVMLGVARSLHRPPDLGFPAFTATVSPLVTNGSPERATQRPRSMAVATAEIVPVSGNAALPERAQGNATTDPGGAVLNRRSGKGSVNSTEDRNTVQEKLQQILELLEERERAGMGSSGKIRDTAPGKQGKTVGTSSATTRDADKKNRFPVATVRPQPQNKEDKVLPPAGQSRVESLPKADLPKESGSLPSAPGIHVDAIVWDTDPGFRLAVINERIVREGEILGDGYQLEKIYHSKIRFSKEGRIYEERVDQRKVRAAQ